MIVAFVSSKGGVGKTTSCVTLGAALARRSRRTLIVDLDPQVSASLSLGLSRAEMIPSAADVLLRAKPASDAIRRTRIGGLDVLPSSADMARAEGDLGQLPRSEMILGRVLERAAEGYDFVLVDCPPGLGLLSRNALAAADAFLVPAVPQFLAVEGIESLTQAVERLAFRTQKRTRFLGILPTMVDYRTNLTRQVLAEMRARFGEAVFAVEIRVNVRLAEAPGTGRTIFEHDGTSTGARSYELAAEELLLRASPREPGGEVAGEATAPSVAARA